MAINSGKKKNLRGFSYRDFLIRACSSSRKGLGRAVLEGVHLGFLPSLWDGFCHPPAAGRGESGGLCPAGLLLWVKLLHSRGIWRKGVQEYSSFQLSVSGEMWGSLVPSPRVLLALGVNFTPEKPSNDPGPAFPPVPGFLELGGEGLGNPDGAVPIIFLIISEPFSQPSHQGMVHPCSGDLHTSSKS